MAKNMQQGTKKNSNEQNIYWLNLFLYNIFLKWEFLEILGYSILTDKEGILTNSFI